MSDFILPGIPKEIFRGSKKKYSETVGREAVLDTRRINRRLEKIIDDSRGNSGVELSERHGFLTYHQTFEHPEKGWRNDHAVRAAWYVKRYLITWFRFLSTPLLIPAYIGFLLTPWKHKIKILERWLKELASVTTLHLRQYTLLDQYYSPCPRELMCATRRFFSLLGIRNGYEGTLGLTLATLLDFDTAYRYRLEDILTETSKEKMLANPRGEIKRLMTLLGRREPKPHLVEKFASFARILSVALLVPKIRKAFVKTIQESKFENFQLDEIEHYHVRNIIGYNFFGMTIEERDKRWPPEQHTWLQVDWQS